MAGILERDWRRRLMAVRALAFGALVLSAVTPAEAETVKIGVVKSTTAAPVYVAVDKGFFAEQGIEPQIVFFDAAQPISVAILSGDLDVGVTGYTGGFYQLLAQGALKIVAAHSGEVPGFHGLGYFVGNHAYEAGLKTFKDIPATVLPSPRWGRRFITAWRWLPRNTASIFRACACRRCRPIPTRCRR